MFRTLQRITVVVVALCYSILGALHYCNHVVYLLLASSWWSTFPNISLVSCVETHKKQNEPYRVNIDHILSIT